MADVKFSELTALAASDVASDDILAIVDTGASTSKKLTIDNLFGAVPVNIAQTDATDATSSAGAVRTAGGVSMAKKLYVGTTSTLVGKMSTENMSLDMGTAAAATTTTISSVTCSLKFGMLLTPPYNTGINTFLLEESFLSFQYESKSNNKLSSTSTKITR